MTAITIERNETSRSPKANRSTKPNTIGIEPDSALLKSSEFAVEPVTAYSTPSTWPTVCGSSSSRRVASAPVEASSVPLPASGISTRVTVPSRFVSTLIGPCISPVASALRSSSATAARTGAALTSSALIATVAGSGVPGKASITCTNGWTTGVLMPSMPVWAVCRLSAGTASARSTALAAIVETTGCRSTGFRIAAPDAVAVVGAAEAVQERDAALLDPVAQLGEDAPGGR